MAHDDNSSSKFFASFRSNISKPSVNQPYTGASRLRASRISANTDREIALTSTKQPSFRPHDPRLFLGLADIENPLALAKAPQVTLRDIIFALSLLERNEINGFVVDELLDVANERLAHRHDGGRGRKALAPVHSKISDHSPHGLQVWHVYVEVHPIDRLKLKHNMVTQYIRHRSCYAHSGLRSSTGLATHRASSSYIQGIVPAGSIGVHLSLAIAINAPSSAYTSSV